MDFKTYQVEAAKTIQSYVSDQEVNKIVPFLGIIGEAGSVITELKKKIRDGDGYSNYGNKLKEELGDVLWYVAAIASQHKIDLDELAVLNLKKVKDRFDHESVKFKIYDKNYPKAEQFPREFEVEFHSFKQGGKDKVKIMYNGEPLGDEITDNSHKDDGYRFHDIFHFGYIAYLGWSPVMRKLMKIKRKSAKNIDENEDGARANITEELVSLFIYNHAIHHQLFKYSNNVDTEILKDVQLLVSGIEVKDCTPKQWEIAIINSYQVYNELRANNGGRVLVSIKNRKLIYLGKN